MPRPVSRRRALQASLAGSAWAGWGDLTFLSGLRPVAAEEVESATSSVLGDDSVLPVVRIS